MCAIPGTKMIRINIWTKEEKEWENEKGVSNFATSFLHISWPSFVPQVAKVEKSELHNGRKNLRAAGDAQVFCIGHLMYYISISCTTHIYMSIYVCVRVFFCLCVDINVDMISLNHVSIGCCSNATLHHYLLRKGVF